MRAGYDKAADGYDDRHGDRRSRGQFAVIDGPQLALSFGARRVLELGCGTGRLLRAAGGSTRIGLDISSNMLRLANGRGLVAVQGDAHRLPFADGAFDVIIAGKGTFRYLRYDAAFSECFRVLEPGGHLGLHQYSAATWSPRQWLRGGARAPEPLHVDDPDEVVSSGRAAGFALRHLYLWRALPIYPYAVRIPASLPGSLWSHCVAIFRKPPLR